MTPESETVFREWMAERNAEMSEALQKVSGHYRLRKITDAADGRMRTRSARQQHADAMAELQRGADDVVPDADDGAAWAGVMR